MEIEESDSARLDVPEVISAGTQAWPQNVCAVGDSAMDLRLQTRRIVLRPQTEASVGLRLDCLPNRANKSEKNLFLGCSGCCCRSRCRRRQRSVDSLDNVIGDVDSGVGINQL